MVNNKIMRLDTLRTLPFSLIHSDVDKFAAAVIKWYQNFKPIAFYEQQRFSDPPNLFFMFNYPDHYGEEVYSCFYKESTMDTMRERNLDYESAKEVTINIFNNEQSDLYPHLLHDVKLILNAYHMFYCFQDDAHVNVRYYNPFVKEVW